MHPITSKRVDRLIAIAQVRATQASVFTVSHPQLENNAYMKLNEKRTGYMNMADQALKDAQYLLSGNVDKFTIEEIKNLPLNGIHKRLRDHFGVEMVAYIYDNQYPEKLYFNGYETVGSILGSDFEIRISHRCPAFRDMSEARSAMEKLTTMFLAIEQAFGVWLPEWKPVSSG
jgi:hypothetical protein